MRIGFRIQKWINQLTIFIFCLVLFIYTMTFPSNTSWFIFIFFILLFTVLLFSTIFFWGKSKITLLTQSNGENDLCLTARTRLGIPILLPSLVFQLTTKDVISKIEYPIYFQNQINLLFKNIKLPRGNYSQMILQTAGKDYFGIFTHTSRKKIPANIDVFPYILSKKEQGYFLQIIYRHPYFYQHLNKHATQFHQIREYRPQDAIKYVDWKTSARRKKMMVKEYENEVLPTLSIVFIGMDSPHFERLLSLTYSLYLDLEKSIPIKLLLIGKYEGQLSAKESLSAFLTIEKESDSHALVEIFSTYDNSSTRMIVITSEKIKKSLQEKPNRKLIFFSESDFLHLEVNKET